jgi:uncharacterized protein with HEPN domain
LSALRRDDLVGDLRDICDEIAGYVTGVGRADFLKDRARQRAIERTLEILGEIATQLGDEAPVADVDWKALRKLRVVLAHAYKRVDASRLWAFATQDVPRLRASLGRQPRG